MSIQPVIVIVGRPNVGKSTLFNRLTRTRRALVHDLPGVTRDRIVGEAERPGGGQVTVVDTGGLLTSLGVAGLTIGFAARDTISNIISGLFIFWESI